MSQNMIQDYSLQRLIGVCVGLLICDINKLSNLFEGKISAISLEVFHKCNLESFLLLGSKNNYSNRSTRKKTYIKKDTILKRV